MRIKNKLTLLFIVIVALLLFVASLIIYYSSANYRKTEFYERLTSKANTNARLLLEIDEVDVNLLKIIEKNNTGTLPEEEVIIFNFNNEKIYSTDEDQDIVITEDLLDKIRLEGEIRWEQGSYEVLGILYKGEFDRFVVVAGAVDRFGLSKLNNLRNILLMVFGGSILFVFFAGRFIAGRALKPISKVIDQVRKISAKNLNARVDEGNGRDEIAELAFTFNKMLDRLEEAFKLQKHFVSNASHELRTPLTAITGQIEVLLLKSRNPEEYQKSLGSILEDIKNLNNLSNRLLMLAQTNEDIAYAHIAPVRIDDLIWQCRSEILDNHTNYQINIEFTETPEVEDKLIVKGNVSLLNSAIKNLMENGCKFSDNHQVDLLIGFNNGHIILKFVDNGLGIAKQDLQHIFQPFYRSERTKNINGHGIGLSLVERIVKIHKGTITVESTLGKGATFTIILPN